MDLSYPNLGGAVNAPLPEAMPVSLAYPGAELTLTQTVYEMSAVHFEGNIVPHSWFKHPKLRYANGKANMLAMMLLADICYWYRPTIQLDETGGGIVSVRKKFAADKLHWDHEQRAEHFGITPRQSKDTIAFLKKAGVITVEVRDKVRTSSGAYVFNQVYVEPVIGMIRQLCGFVVAKVAAAVGVFASHAPAPIAPPAPPPAPLPPAPSSTLAAPDPDENPSEKATGKPAKDTSPLQRVPPHVTTCTPPLSNVPSHTAKRAPSTKSSSKISPNNVERLEEQNMNNQVENEATLPDGLPEFIKAAIKLTGDYRSLARLEQLYAICCEEHNYADDWKKAIDATTRWLSVTPAEARRSAPGAYFDTTLRRLLEKRNVHIPSAAERAEGSAIRGAITQGLFGGEPSHG